MKFSRSLPIALLLLSTTEANAQLQINELMQSNIDCIMDDLNEFPDSWVELYNSGQSAIDLHDYSICNKNDPTKEIQSK